MSQKNKLHLQPASALFTDMYSLTMMQGYFLLDKNFPVSFDMFIRKPSKDIGYMIFAGLHTLLEQITSLRFTDDDIYYLKSLETFQDSFLEYLRNFRFRGDVWAMHEGSVCFPQEPVLTVHAKIIEAQLIEGIILNHINFQTLIATRAARVCHATKGKKVVEFGLRRAQGPNGALYASRAAYIGGVSGTSNTEAGKIFGIPVSGTMAHSWVMSFEDELEAFMQFSELYPSNVVLLLDTHNTLESGLKNAITVGKKLVSQGIDFSVRLDSGDLEYLSKKVRLGLDNAGLNNAKIIATNDLNEEVISQITSSNAPIDAFGIGTKLITGADTPALPGVYKISEIDRGEGMVPLIKTSNNIDKSSLPSSKQVYRFSNELYFADLILIRDEQINMNRTLNFHHPFIEQKKMTLSPPYQTQKLLHHYVHEGKIIKNLPQIEEIRTRTQTELEMLDTTFLRLIYPHNYVVSISDKLRTIRDSLLYRSESEII